MATPCDPLATAMKIRITRKAWGEAVILRDITLEIGPREAVALLGPSGIGKSTLLRIVAGLDTGFEGNVTDAGRIAMAFQEPTLLPWRSVRDNLTLTTNCTPGEADALLQAVGLPDAGARFPNTLSLGQARRISLARAFAMRPDTLLLDEPFASLDREAAARMLALLLDLLRDHPARLILVTHDPMEAARLATRVLTLGGTPATVQRERYLDESPADRDEARIMQLLTTL